MTRTPLQKKKKKKSRSWSFNTAKLQETVKNQRKKKWQHRNTINHAVWSEKEEEERTNIFHAIKHKSHALSCKCMCCEQRWLGKWRSIFADAASVRCIISIALENTRNAEDKLQKGFSKRNCLRKWQKNKANN